MAGILHADFAENWVPISKAAMIGITAETDSGYVLLRDYLRIAVVIHALAVTTTLDVDIEIAKNGSGLNAFTYKSAAQLISTDDNKTVVFDIRPDELSNPAGTSVMEFTHLNVEVTPSGAATASVIVYGVPANKPRAGLWDQAIT